MKRLDVNTLRTPRRHESGFTIVELMVGMLIGLISIVVMFQVFAVSEGQRRTTTGAGDAQQNGVTSLYLMERDARMSGYGLNFFRLLGCSTHGFWTPSVKTIDFTLAPVVIANGAGGTAPDKITFMYSDADTYTFPASLALPTSAAASGFVRIKEDRFTFKPGDLFVVGEVPQIPTGALKDCSMFQATQLPGDPNQPAGPDKQINFFGASYIDTDVVTHPANYVPPTANASTQPAPNANYYAAWTPKNANASYGGRVLNLGQQPTVMEYSVVNNQLVARDLLRPDLAATPISDGIVQMQAQYGLSNHDLAGAGAGGTCVLMSTTLSPCLMSPSATNAPALNLTNTTNDQWADAFPAGTVLTPGDWRRIIAVRFIIVARSGQKEKLNPATGLCDATPYAPVWSANNQSIDLTADPEWQCYRYRTFEAVVPIRNFMWYPDPMGTSIPAA
jgi:type IV pilus assembly protein PilW